MSEAKRAGRESEASLLAQRKRGMQAFEEWELQERLERWRGKTFEDKSFVYWYMVQAVRERRPDLFSNSPVSDVELRKEPHLCHLIDKIARLKAVDRLIRKHT